MLPTGAQLWLKILKVNGQLPGRSCFITAAVHGDELNGVLVAREVYRRIDPSQLRGTLYIVPLANPFAVVEQSRYLPDRRDLNRSFPGRQKGPLAKQLAWNLQEHVLDKCNVGLDLHAGSGGRVNLPQVRVDLDDEERLAAARAFGAPALVHSPPAKSTLRDYCKDKEVLLYEAGEAMRFGRRSIQIGWRGTLRALRHWGFLDDAPAATEPSVLVRERRWLRAPNSGFVDLSVKVGDMVEKGQLLATIVDAVGDSESELRAPHAGLMIGRLNNAIAYRGDAILHLAELVA